MDSNRCLVLDKKAKKKTAVKSPKDRFIDCPICSEQLDTRKKDKAKTHILTKHFGQALIQRNNEMAKKPDYPEESLQYVCRVCHFSSNNFCHFVCHLGKQSHGPLKGLVDDGSVKKFFQGQFTNEEDESDHTT